MADFATKEAVTARLGRSLTSAEEAQVEGVLAAISGLIRAEVGKAPSWDPSPIPSVLSELAIQKAIAAVTNPTGVAQESESVGSYSHSQTFPRSQDNGIFLSDAEGRAVRFAVFGTNAGTARVRSHVDTVLDLADDGEINNSLGS